MANPSSIATAKAGFCWKMVRNITPILHSRAWRRDGEGLSVGLRGCHRDVVTGVGGVFGELGFQNFSRIRHAAELGNSGRHGRLGANRAVYALYERNGDPDIRVVGRFYLYDAGVFL